MYPSSCIEKKLTIANNIVCTNESLFIAKCGQECSAANRVFQLMIECYSFSDNISDIFAVAGERSSPASTRVSTRRMHGVRVIRLLHLVQLIVHIARLIVHIGKFIKNLITRIWAIYNRCGFNLKIIIWFSFIE